MHLMLPSSLAPPSLLLLLLSGCRSLIGSQTIQPASRSGMLRVGRWLRGCEAGDCGGEGKVGVDVLVLGRVLGIRGEVWRGGGVEGREIEGKS